MPSSSAHCRTGSTTSAIAAVSDSRKSHTHQQIEGAQPVDDVPGPGRRHREVGAVHHQRAWSAGAAEHVEQFVRAAARPGQVRRIDAPTRVRRAACNGIADLAVAGQLVRLLPVFAATLAVALTGDRAVTAAPPAGQAQRERQPDPRRDGVGAARVLLRAARGEHVRARVRPSGPRQDLHGAPQRRDRDPGHPFGALWPPLCRCEPRGVEAGRAGLDETPGRGAPR